MARVDLILDRDIRYKLEGETAQLSLSVRLQQILSPCIYELVQRIALLIRFSLNQRITLKRLERRFKLLDSPARPGIPAAALRSLVHPSKDSSPFHTGMGPADP